MNMADKWRRQEQRSAFYWASRIGEEAGRLRERRRMVMFTANALYFTFVPLYWIGLSTGSQVLNILSWSLAGSGVVLAWYAAWVSRQAKAAMAGFLHRSRKEVRRAPLQRMSTFDAWLLRHPPRQLNGTGPGHT